MMCGEGGGRVENVWEGEHLLLLKLHLLLLKLLLQFRDLIRHELARIPLLLQIILTRLQLLLMVMS